MNMIDTIKGPLPEDELDISLHRFDSDDTFTLAREYMHHGELVRRDVWVTAKRGPAIGANPGRPN